MKKLLFLCLAFISIISLNAQGLQDPAVNDADILPNPLGGIGTQFDIVFTIANNGLDDITGADAANRFSFEIDLYKCAPSVAGNISTIGTDALSGPALAFFNFTYDAGLNKFSAQQKNGASIGSLTSWDINIHAEVTDLSVSLFSNTVGALLDISPNTASAGFNDTDNDNGEALTHTLTTLPVELISFTGVSDNCNTQLSWKTAMEDKFSRFEIQYSAEGNNFSSLKSIPGRNSFDGAEYNTIINGPGAGGYYRLKMIDIDGRFEYSNIIIVKENCNEGRITISSNPIANNITTIRGLSGKTVIRLYDSNGQQLMHTTISNSTHTVNFATYPAGVYILRVKDNATDKSFRLIKP